MTHSQDHQVLPNLHFFSIKKSSKLAQSPSADEFARCDSLQLKCSRVWEHVAALGCDGRQRAGSRAGVDGSPQARPSLRPWLSEPAHAPQTALSRHCALPPACFPSIILRHPSDGGVAGGEAWRSQDRADEALPHMRVPGDFPAQSSVCTFVLLGGSH